MPTPSLHEVWLICNLLYSILTFFVDRVKLTSGNEYLVRDKNIESEQNKEK